MTVGKIALAREFFSNELGCAEAKMRIKDELSSYCVVTEAPKTTFGKVAAAGIPRDPPTQLDPDPNTLTRARTVTPPTHLLDCTRQVRTTYTGKLYGKQDDLAIALQLSLIGCQKDSSCNSLFQPLSPAHTRTHTHTHTHTHTRTRTRARIHYNQFFQEPKYRNFRAPDYLTPNGLAA